MKLDIFPLKAIDENPTSKLKEFSMNSQNVSTWMAKRQRSKVERDLDVLKNRINLLSQVERKAKKQLNEIKAKANKAIETKLAIEEQNSKVLFLNHKI